MNKGTAMKTKENESGLVLRGGVPTRQPGLQNSPAVLARVARAIEATSTLEIKQGENCK